jgi:hypothetical protein
LLGRQKIAKQIAVLEVLDDAMRCRSQWAFFTIIATVLGRFGLLISGY